MKTWRTITLALPVLLSACATNTETVLKNERGETRYCYLTNDRTLSSIGAVNEYSRCVNEAGTAGFRKVN